MATSAKKAEMIINDRLKAEEDLLDELENEEIPASIREARMKELKNLSRDLGQLKENDHGKYTEILEEKNFLDITIAEERCIVHFFHPDFERCAIMDKHLKVLSAKHFEARFMKINVEKAQFFVVKLKILVLPAVLCFRKGIVVGRLIGFEELGNVDDFPTGLLERKLLKMGVIMEAERQTLKPARTTRMNNNNSDSDEE